MTDRAYDIVLFGATGFTGALTAEYLAEHAPPEARLALAGRNRQKLETVRAKLSPARQEMPLLHADVNDAASLKSVAESARVVISTVGPYILYGEPLVAACAQAGTDYVDLTGEPEFVDQMWLRYDGQARETGARIVHSCGFDSIPYDLGALFTVQQLPEGVPIDLNCYFRMGGTFSGGTYHSAINGFARLRQTASAALERRRREERPSGRKIRGKPGPPRRVGHLNAWALPVPTIDPQHVLRSARALDRYGPEFTYGHYLLVKRLATIVALAGGTGAAIGLAQLPPTRKLLLRIKDPGEGPSPEQREKSWFKVRFEGEGGGKRVATQVSGGDPGYGETAKMLSESALSLAFDQHPDKRAGSLTPAVAIGQPLIDRLNTAGIKFEVLES